MGRIALVFFVSLTVLLLGYALLVAYVDSRIRASGPTDAYEGCNKVWAPRGLAEHYTHTKSDENSLEAVQRAFSAGAVGVEIDLHYDVQSDRFIISHDHPVRDATDRLVYTLANGRIQTLDEILDATGDGHYFWLDFKNLDKLSTKETVRAIQHLKNITSRRGLRQRTYIEGSNPLKLAKYSEAGLRTVLGIHPLYESTMFSRVVISLYKLVYYFCGASGISIKYGEVERPIYGPRTQDQLAGVPVFVFHVPDNTTLIRSLVVSERVRVILVGGDTSPDRFAINACGGAGSTAEVPEPKPSGKEYLVCWASQAQHQPTGGVGCGSAKRSPTFTEETNEKP